MSLEKSEIHKILLISLTNIGDVILTCPVLDILLHDFPQAKISLVVGPKARTLFAGNPRLKKVYIYNKKQPFWRTIFWIWKWRRAHFDLVVDLRNTAIPFLVAPKNATPPADGKPWTGHMKAKHLHRLRMVHTLESEPPQRQAVYIPERDCQHVDELLRQKWPEKPAYIVVAPGAADQTKRWSDKGFQEVCYQLVKQYQVNIVLVGDEHDRPAAERIAEVDGEHILNLCGRTTLLQLAEVLTHALMAIVNDSAPMHMASYLDVPVLALFGPTDVTKYGPWSGNCRYLKRDHFCPACQNPKGAKRHTCMSGITSADVLGAFQLTNGKVVFNKP